LKALKICSSGLFYKVEHSRYDFSPRSRKDAKKKKMIYKYLRLSVLAVKIKKYFSEEAHG
jgi:hypothetical protein